MKLTILLLIVFPFFANPAFGYCLSNGVKSDTGQSFEDRDTESFFNLDGWQSLKELDFLRAGLFFDDMLKKDQMSAYGFSGAGMVCMLSGVLPIYKMSPEEIDSICNLIEKEKSFSAELKKFFSKPYGCSSDPTYSYSMKRVNIFNEYPNIASTINEVSINEVDRIFLHSLALLAKHENSACISCFNQAISILKNHRDYDTIMASFNLTSVRMQVGLNQSIFHKIDKTQSDRFTLSLAKSSFIQGRFKETANILANFLKSDLIKEYVKTEAVKMMIHSLNQINAVDEARKITEEQKTTENIFTFCSSVPKENNEGKSVSNRFAHELIKKKINSIEDIITISECLRVSSSGENELMDILNKINTVDKNGDYEISPCLLDRIKSAKYKTAASLRIARNQFDRAEKLLRAGVIFEKTKFHNRNCEPGRPAASEIANLFYMRKEFDNALIFAFESINQFPVTSDIVRIGKKSADYRDLQEEQVFFSTLSDKIHVISDSK